MLIGLTLAFATTLCHARAVPSPGQKPAPGNEVAQTPIAEAGYSPAVNYELQCSGCHRNSGEGSKANDTPRLANFVGNFLRVQGGREFLVQVPGVSQSALSDAQTAALLNWMLREDGMAGASRPVDVKPYSTEEVAALRKQPMLSLPQTRADLIAQMRTQGIAIDDVVTRP
ncbi:cytochrome c [Pseudomonas sp. GD03860]|uniref:cytochrome C n=1 Tax=Pseudomonas TaxID=286 RepID=UPI002364327A|nr:MULTISPECIES: cytochrome C [Pseudomonas]MDD2058462.1 cytochrome c [Pseudomonas putida]MDH0640437.1 cytochrome c [Pseudomonas sp. GD03860]